MRRLTVFAVGFGIGWILMGMSCQPRPRAREYRVLYSAQPAQTSHVLDSLGAEGWRLVTANGPILYFERAVTR